MNLTQENVNEFLNRYIDFVTRISSKFGYPANIRHLLYVVVPAFVVKYGASFESSVLKCFESVPIYLSHKENPLVPASFCRTLCIIDGQYETEKYVLLNNFEKVGIARLLDSIVHEYNHAMNSLHQEISYDEKFIKVRTGLSFLVYDRKTLQFLHKTLDVALEEVINTEQTEEIINIIHSFHGYSLDNVEFSNMLYVLDKEISFPYVSNAYLFQSSICETLMKNKTFTPLVCQLRLKGFVEEVPKLFDQVIGREGSYQRLVSLLDQIHELELKYAHQKLFKGRTLAKLKDSAHDVISLLSEYDQKCIYKS